jgi:hypothetical protein
MTPRALTSVSSVDATRDCGVLKHVVKDCGCLADDRSGHDQVNRE